MIQELLDILNTVGQVADTPGAFARTALAGQNPFESVFDTEKRVSGRDLLERYGLLDANQEGLDLGDVAGFATEFVTDPMNLIGLGLAGKAGMANKAIRAGNEANLLRHGEESALAGLHNYDVDAAYRKLDEMLSGVKSTPNMTISADAIPGDVSEALKHNLPGITDQQIWSIVRGAPIEVADTILPMKGSSVREAHPIAKALGDRAGVAAYGHPPIRTPEGDILGMVLDARPDVMFVSGQTVPAATGIATHELTHTLGRRLPDRLTHAIEALGDAGVNAVNTERFPGRANYGAIMEKLSRGRKYNQEEALATAVGKAAMRGAARQRFPVTDALHVDYQDLIPEFGSLIREKYPSTTEPEVVAAHVLDYIFGPKPKGNALVPSGALQDLSSPKSFAQGAQMTGDELAAIRSGYQPLPDDPWFTPTNSQKPLAYLMSMLNALTVPERASHQ